MNKYFKKNYEYIFKKYIFHYKYNDYVLIIENDQNFKTIINLIYYYDNKILNFEISN